jgi:DNA-directed RNA polymerase specialized sigma24 family protein
MMTGEAATVAAVNHEADAAADRLGALFDAHHQRLYRLARRMSRSADEARDLVQDTFCVRRAHQAPCHGARQPRKPGWCEWLVNLCRDRWRQTANRERLDRATAPTRIESTDPEAALVARSVSGARSPLSIPGGVLCWVMHELEGSPVEVIARTLGVTRSRCAGTSRKDAGNSPPRYLVKGERHEGTARLVDRRRSGCE